MELMQLEMFLAVVEERSVNRAAERVCRTQPAVSIALRKLEQEFGQALLHRPRRGMYRLTPAGELMYGLAIQIVSLRNEAVCALRGAVLTIPGRLTVGIDSIENVARLMPTLNAFRRQNLGVRIELCMDVPSRLASDLVDRKLDLLLLSKPVTENRMSMVFVAEQLNIGKGALMWLLHPKTPGCEMAKRFTQMVLSSVENADGKGKAIHQRKMGTSNVA